MARRKNLGIDSWTSNGHGITMGKPTAAQKEAVKQVNAELAAAKKAKSTTAPTKKKK